MDLDKALQAHGEWKLKLRTAINKKEQLDAKTISADNCCPLGQWLHGEARGKYNTLRAYTQCVSKHADFHREAGKIASAINQGKYAEAEAMLNGGTPYAAASSAVGGAILGLKKEAAL
jgi:methyl-accepting chemotaxis protein